MTLQQEFELQCKELSFDITTPEGSSSFMREWDQVALSEEIINLGKEIVDKWPSDLPLPSYMDTNRDGKGFDFEFDGMKDKDSPRVFISLSVDLNPKYDRYLVHYFVPNFKKEEKDYLYTNNLDEAFSKLKEFLNRAEKYDINWIKEIEYSEEQK